jgi:autotransporter-associated beta strand protein
MLFLRSPRTWLAWFTIAAILCPLLAPSVRAVIIEGGDGKGNTTAPADAIGDPGWANVGHGNASCVYLGNRWVLTCAHVGSANTTFNGIAYNLVVGSCIRLHESIEGNAANPVDLLLYRLDAAPPGLANIAIANATPLQGSLVTAVGLGTERGTPTPYGFQWGPSYSTKRWGRNLVSSSYSGTINIGTGNTHVFQTQFDANPSSSLDPSLAFNEFQASSGDSGGAVFQKVDNAWKLAGLIEAVSTNGYANYGDNTYCVDLRYYGDQIAGAMATCPFSGTIANPVATLGAGVSAYLSGNGGFQSVAGNCSVAVDTKSYLFTFDTSSNTISQTGAISGSGGFIKKGVGILKLTQHNAFSGNTTISQGILILDGGDLANSPLITVAPGANLQVIRGTPQLINISGGGSISIAGSATALTARSIHLDTLSIGNAPAAAAAIPEPSGLILVGTLLLGLLTALCRRRFGWGR